MKKIPCKECISFAICINQSMVKCSILYNYYTDMIDGFGKPIKQYHANIMESIVKFLSKTDWSIHHDNELIVYKVIESNKEGPAMEKPNIVYKLSNGALIYYHDNDTTYEIESLNALSIIKGDGDG